MKEFTIRTATTADAKRLLEIYSYYVENTAITFEYEVPSLKQFESLIQRTIRKYPYLVVEKNGIIQGYAYANPFKERAAYDWSCELSIYLDHKSQKQGLGRKLYEALEEDLFKRGMLNLYACIAVPKKEDEYLTNNSAQFHEHMGYETVGTFHECGYKFDQWYDMIWMEKRIGKHERKQTPVRFG